MNQNDQYDVAVVGAGSAGLQAALTLGRMRRRVVVFDTGRHRNDPAGEMHNFLGHDGSPPAELRAVARKDVERYDTVTFVDDAVAEVSGEPDRFTLALEDGGSVTARRVLLATGVVDALPEVPGVRELFGGVVAHCPYCHGYEFADSPVAILGSDAHVARTAGLIERLASSITVLTNGAELDPETADTLREKAVEVRTEPVLGVRRSPGGLTAELAGTTPLELGGMFVATQWTQATPFAEQLGLELSPQGAIVVDGFGRTSRPGVSAAGDLAQPPGLPMPMASVLSAAAQGLTAASGFDMELMYRDQGLPVPV